MATETAVIKNEPLDFKKPLRIPKGEHYSLDFASSPDAAEVDAGIRETLRGVKLSIMAMGIALYRMDVGAMYSDLGFKKFGEYIDHLAEDSGMSRTNLYNWEYIGEAYITHRADLDKVGFNDADGPTKLPFLARALAHRQRREVFKNIKNMTKREFEEWSREPLIENDTKYKSVKIKGAGVYVGNSPIVSFSEDIAPSERKYYEGLLMEGARAIEQNEYARLYRFYDADEARRFDRIYQRELKALRASK